MMLTWPRFRIDLLVLFLIALALLAVPLLREGSVVLSHHAQNSHLNEINAAEILTAWQGGRCYPPRIYVCPRYWIVTCGGMGESGRLVGGLRIVSVNGTQVIINGHASRASYWERAIRREGCLPVQ